MGTRKPQILNQPCAFKTYNEFSAVFFLLMNMVDFKVNLGKTPLWGFIEHRLGTTAIDAHQRGYNQVFATDAMSASSTNEHEATLKYIFPRIGQLRTTDEILKATIKDVKEEGPLI